MKEQEATVVSLTSVLALAPYFQVLCHSFLCDGQGTVKRAILYIDRSCEEYQFYLPTHLPLPLCVSMKYNCGYRILLCFLMRNDWFVSCFELTAL